MKNNKLFIIETIIAGFIFLYLLAFNIKISELIVLTLTFIIVLELVRIVVDFIIKSKHVIDIKYILDGFIAFFLRDIVLIFSEKDILFSEKKEKIIFLLFIIFVFFIFRILRIKTLKKELKNHERIDK
jgi:hypothetical protein